MTKSTRALAFSILIVLQVSDAHAAKTAGESAGKSDDEFAEFFKTSSKRSSRASANAPDLAKLKAQLAENAEKIKTTEAEIKRIKDADFLPNLFFALADLHIEKSRLLYMIKLESRPGTPSSELDFTAELRPKQTAVDIYQKIYTFFTSYPRRDRALFYQARELHDLGKTQAMITTYAQLMKEFPESPYWLEANIALGDFMLEERRDVDGALEAYGRVLAKPRNLFSALASYRAAWCHVNKGDFEKAFQNFDSAIEIFDKTDKSVLPDAYARVDIRRDAVVAAVYPFVELYSDKNMRHLLKDASPLAAFRSRSDSFLTYYKALGRLARRLSIKELWQESAEAYLELLEVSDDRLTRLEAASRFYECFKRGKLQSLDFGRFQKQAALLIQDLRTATQMAPNERTNSLKKIEVFMRDVATSQQAIAARSRRAEDFSSAFDLYSDYSWALPASPFNQDMLANKAESAFNSRRLIEAGIAYERVVRAAKAGRTKFAGHDYAESALQSYTQALRDSDKLSMTDLVQARSGLRQVGLEWLRLNIRKPAAATVQFNIARSWYDERDFSNSIKEIDRFIKTFPSNEKVMDAVAIALNSYSQLDDHEGLAKAGARYLSLARLNDADRDSIRSMVRNAQLKRVQAKAGQFGTREYAKNLKDIASSNKGTELGEQALYEAFISLKSKRDVQTFEVGEQLLRSSSGDSGHAKEVSATMAQIALSTADFGRAARYFEDFAVRYPKESESASWLRSAGNLYEWMGDYGKARAVFQRLGDSEAVARMDFLARDWNALLASAAAVPGLSGQYLQAIALVRQKKFGDAAPMLSKIAGQPASAKGEDREMIAHSAYLLSSAALERFASIRMRDANDQEALQNKVKSYQALSADLGRVAKMQSGRWTIAALYGLGQANYDLGKFIEQSPAPAGLSAEEAGQYRRELQKQAAGYLAQAKQHFATCLTTAEKFEVFTRFVEGCRARGAKSVSEERDTELRGKAADSYPPAAAKIRYKLYDQPRDVSSLLALARVYLEAGDYAMAAAIDNRILEIEPKEARAQAGRGVAFLYMNDLERAHTEFKKALELDPRNGIALWNIAGLMNEFKFDKKRAEAVRRARTVPKPDLLHPFARRI